jgi:hypothetical protein
MLLFGPWNSNEHRRHFIYTITLVLGSFFVISAYLQQTDNKSAIRGSSIKEQSNEMVTIGEDPTEHRKQKQEKAMGLKLQQELQENPPEIIHLMSFPNSGTTFTLASVEALTKSCTASHIGSKNTPEVMPKSSNTGPFYQCKYRNSQIPEKYVLTKAHCNSFCKQCHTYQVADRDTKQKGFERGCHSGNEKHPCNYDLKLVKKNIHLVRNPFDNVVARFHNSFKTHKEGEPFKKDSNNSEVYKKSLNGFHSYCSWHNAEYSSKRTEKFLVDPKHEALANKVPCVAEFFKYITWHNLAFETIKKMGVPSMILYYEDYNYEDTLPNLLSFLEAEEISEAPAFFWHDYPEYYGEEARSAAMTLMKSWASKDTLGLINRYLADSDSSAHNSLMRN